jgi:hypothetical protein
MSTRVALRPSGAQGCSHGWSESALRLAQPVDPVRETNPAPEGRRTQPTRAGTHEHPKIPSPLPGRPAALLPLHGFRSPLRGSLHPWRHSGVPSGRSIPAQASSPRLRRHGLALQPAAAHFLRSSPGLRASSTGLRGVGAGPRRAGIPLRGGAPGLRGRAPLPSGSAGARSGRVGAFSNSLGGRDGRPGQRDDSPVACDRSSGGRDGSSVACDSSSVACDKWPVAWRGNTPQPPPRSRLWPFRGVFGVSPPASAHDPCSPNRTTRRRTRQHS